MVIFKIGHDTLTIQSLKIQNHIVIFMYTLDILHNRDHTYLNHSMN